MTRISPLPAQAVLIFVFVQLLPAWQASGKKHFSYEQVFGSHAPAGAAEGGDAVIGQLPEVMSWSDDLHYLEARTDPSDRQRRVFRVSARDGSSLIYRDYGEIQKELPPGLSAHRPETTTPDLGRFIYTHENDLYYYNAETKHLSRLTANPAKEQNPRFSPDGKWIAYTRGHNLLAYDLENRVEHQYTSDGSDTVYNGWASWVYYEEILGRESNYAAFWWSPDSTRLAFMRFDDSPVPVFPIFHADGPHGRIEMQRYPKAGDPNPHVSIGVVRAAGSAIAWMDFDPKADHYIAWPFWSADGSTLMVQWMNRGQDTIRLYSCDPASGKKSPLHEEKQSSWVRFFEDIYYFKNGSGFLLRSDVDGWDHIYYYNSDGSLKKRLTSGQWRVDSIERVHEESGHVYFTGRPSRSWDVHLMRVKLDGTDLKRLTQGEGIHRVQVSPKGDYFIDTVSTVREPPAMNLYREDGTLVRKLADARLPAMDRYAWGTAELFTIPSGDGFDLPAYWVLPDGFNPENSYPVIFNVYGGPDYRTVRNTWPGLQPHYWAQRGVISITVDHRGAGAFGKAGAAFMHRNLGKWEMADLIAAVRWLRDKPFIDKDRIGVTGNSYGGYATLMALTYGAEYFSYGVAGSPVTDWTLYDTVYTERYMDTPAENPQGYQDSSVLRWMDRYKGLVRIHHGGIDDNVHMQNSIQVVNWLTSNNRSFELMLYPGSRHAIQASQRSHLLRETHDFFVRNLLGGTSPEPAAASR